MSRYPFGEMALDVLRQAARYDRVNGLFRWWMLWFEGSYRLEADAGSRSGFC